MAKTYHLNIDGDKKCTDCGEKGVTKSGMCLKCITDRFKDRKIGFLTMQQSKTEICSLLDDYRKEIDESYIKAGGSLTVVLGVKLEGTKLAGEVKITASISFVESRVKQSVEVIVDEAQMDLPGVE